MQARGVKSYLSVSLVISSCLWSSSAVAFLQRDYGLGRRTVAQIFFIFARKGFLKELEMNENEEMVMPSWNKFRAGFHNEVEAIMAKAAISPKGRNYVFRALENPSRRTRSGVANVSGAYPSQKMGMSIGFESRTLEFSRIVANEANPLVRGYVAQLPQLKLAYKCGKTGRKMAYLQRPDLLELYEDHIEVVECKPQSVLRAWLQDRPGFLFQDEQGEWRCPPAEEACAELGLNYRIVCERDLPPRRIKNFGLLIDYIQTGYDHGRDRHIRKITDVLRASRRLSIEDVLSQLGAEITVDDLYRAIAIGMVSVDLDECSLVDHERTFLYSSEATMQAYKTSASAISGAATWMRKSVVDLKPGTRLNWDGRVWDLLNLGLTKVTLHDAGIMRELERMQFDHLLRTSAILPADEAPVQIDCQVAESHRILQDASPNDLARALRAYHEILPYRQGLATKLANRSVRRYLCKWRKAEAAVGNGFLGLLPHYAASGNRVPRIDTAVMKIVKKQTTDHYETTKKSKRNHVHERIVAQCERDGLPAPSYAWYCRYIKRMPAYELKKAREGRKAAYNLEPRQENDGSITDSRADAPWQKAYLDHTELELETRCSSTSALLGRPWLTTLVDDNSADILAWHLTWDPPSYRSVLMTLRDCVERHGRMPSEIVVDGGKDMASTWFETVCAFFSVTITRRPAGKARFGSRGERIFGTIDTSFLHNCLGNTQLRKNVRQMTPEVDPNHKAVWTIGALRDAFEQYFEHYRNLPHRELLVCPRVAMERGVLAGSGRAERRIIYDRDFLISTCPTTRSGQAKVQADGVKINYLYYSAPTLRLAFGKKVPIRFEPADMSIAYALVDGRWIELTSRFANTLKGRTERELEIARAEYFRHRSLVEKTRLTEKTFVTFLEYLDRTEEMLIEHHRAIEMRRSAGVPMPVHDEGDEKDDYDSDELAHAPAVAEPRSPLFVVGEIVSCEVE
jgi:putative transposase